MSYVYQWIGVVNAWAFMTGCMIGMASVAARQQGFARVPVAEAERRARGGSGSR
jgi:hypothetical protein